MRLAHWHPAILALLALTACVAALAAALCLWVLIDGSVVVRDDTGAVDAVVVKAGDTERALYRLPGGVFVGVPDSDATIQARCRNGTIAQGDYVSRNIGLSARVVSDAPCRLQTLYG